MLHPRRFEKSRTLDQINHSDVATTAAVVKIFPSLPKSNNSYTNFQIVNMRRYINLLKYLKTFFCSATSRLYITMCNKDITMYRSFKMMTRQLSNLSLCCFKSGSSAPTKTRLYHGHGERVRDINVMRAFLKLFSEQRRCLNHQQ